MIIFSSNIFYKLHSIWDGIQWKTFKNLLSSAETQQPVNRMQHKARGCLVLSVLR